MRLSAVKEAAEILVEVLPKEAEEHRR